MVYCATKLVVQVYWEIQLLQLDRGYWKYLIESL